MTLTVVDVIAAPTKSMSNLDTFTLVQFFLNDDADFKTAY